MNWLGTAAFAITFLITGISNAFATPSGSLHLSDPPLHLTPTPSIMASKNGIWLPTDQMEQVLLRLEKFPALESLIADQDTLIAAQAAQIKTATTAVKVEHELRLEQTSRGNDLAKKAEDQANEIESLNSWTHSPILWAGVGAGAIVGIVIVLRTILPSAPILVR